MASINWADSSYGSFEAVISGHREFASAVRRELIRSERYCSFASLLSIALEKLDEWLQSRLSEGRESAVELSDQLAEAVRSAVRATDIVAVISCDRIGLLLVETPREGALVLAKRLKDHLSHFFHDSGEPASPVSIHIEVGSFPDDVVSIERILGGFWS